MIGIPHNNKWSVVSRVYRLAAMTATFCCACAEATIVHDRGREWSDEFNPGNGEAGLVPDVFLARMHHGRARLSKTRGTGSRGLDWAGQRPRQAGTRNSNRVVENL